MWCALWPYLDREERPPLPLLSLQLLSILASEDEEQNNREAGSTLEADEDAEVVLEGRMYVGWYFRLRDWPSSNTRLAGLTQAGGGRGRAGGRHSGLQHAPVGTAVALGDALVCAVAALHGGDGSRRRRRCGGGRGHGGCGRRHGSHHFA